MKQKIAVLGGGCGSMAAVWTLTGRPDWRDRYDITVYQMGWRLGGKGASGRNAGAGQRIEEHGLHIWGGFYENAFRVMQDCYAALPSDPANPIRTWTDAFHKLSRVMLQEQVDGRWVPWPFDFPEDDEVPGSGGELPTPWAYLKLLLGWIKGWLEPRHAAATGQVPPPAQAQQPAHAVLAGAHAFAHALPDDPAAHAPEHHARLLDLLLLAHRSLDREERRVRIVAGLGIALLRGLVADGVVLHGFERINDQEWSAWLRRHGAGDEVVQSAFVRGIYDYVFAYEKGDAGRPSIEAGTATHGVLRLLFTYKGALFWEMQAGMGDIVFGPLYRALRARGVQFRFFHKLDAVRVSADGKNVEALDLQVQARVKSEAEYEPLVRVRGVPSWPAAPLYDQLVEGDELRRQDVNLESHWTPWKGAPLRLQRVRDFDRVILGISVGALGSLCQELLQAHAPFRRMVEGVATVQTASMQLWFRRDGAALGAPVGRATTAYAQDMNTWSDMSFLLPREDWPGVDQPRFLAYFCGQFPDAAVIPPPADTGFPAREQQRHVEACVQWLRRNTGPILPGAARPDDPGALDEARLYGPFAAQYFRVNIDPSERYVMSTPGSSALRLRAGESGFGNLFLAGDWVKTSINAGCVEAAVMAGMDAANAISGANVPIIGGLT